jgi:hypothetical protein
MCQTVTEESLSQFQLDKLAELRAKLGDQLLAETPLFNDNFSLLRWLDAWDYRIGQSREHLIPKIRYQDPQHIAKSLKNHWICLIQIRVIQIHE